MSFLEVFRHRISEHTQRARAEGRAFEVQILALFEEFVMSTVQDLQGKIGEQGDKLSQLEADVKDLVTKQGGTAGGPTGSGLSISQEALDAAVQKISDNNDRIEALKNEVVNGPVTPPSTPLPPSEPPVTTPPSTTPPVETPPSAPSAPAPGP